MLLLSDKQDYVALETTCVQSQHTLFCLNFVKSTEEGFSSFVISVELAVHNLKRIDPHGMLGAHSIFYSH